MEMFKTGRVDINKKNEDRRSCGVFHERKREDHTEKSREQL